jgi:hypothetical protein
LIRLNCWKDHRDAAGRKLLWYCCAGPGTTTTECNCCCVCCGEVMLMQQCQQSPLKRGVACAGNGGGQQGIRSHYKCGQRAYMHGGCWQLTHKNSAVTATCRELALHCSDEYNEPFGRCAALSSFRTTVADHSQ